MHAHLHIAANYPDLSRWGASLVLEELAEQPGLLLCVATGSSPLGTYRELAFHAQEDPRRFERLRVIKLDEWGPLAADDPASCEYYIRREIVEPLRVSKDRYFTLTGNAARPDDECRRYAEVLEQAGPIDVCVLGLGVNGHLGLNEPAHWLHDTVHVAELTPDSRGHSMLAVAHRQPEYGLTLGMGDILRSRRILLLVSGKQKCEPLRRFLTRRIATEFPASLLWLHGDVTVACDREAFSDD